MKKSLLFLLIAAFSSSLFAQAPEIFNFQTVVRDESGQVVPLQEISLKFVLHADSPSGAIVYQEKHIVLTNPMGLVSLTIGSGEVLQGSFSQINWSQGEYFLEELVDLGNTGDFQLFGIVQMLSVPYALHANTSGDGIKSMSTEERDAIENPTVGMQIYNTTTNCINYWSGSNWFEACGNCTPQPDNANAGPDQLYNDSTTVVTLEANDPEFGTGLWTKSSGYQGWFEDPDDPTSKFHGEPCKVYYLKWTISTSCGSDYDYVKVTFNNTPSQAIAGEDILINSEETTVTLNAAIPENGIGQWNILTGAGGSFDDNTNPVAEFTGEPCQSYSLQWQVSTECHANKDTVNVEFYAIPTTAYAGADTTINNENLTITLNGNTPEVGTGAWSIISGEGGSFDDAANPSTEFTAQPCETYDLLWTISTACEMSSDTVTLDFFTLPTEADTGADQLDLTGTWTTLAANTPEIGTGHWTILSGEGGQITNPDSPTSVFLGQNMEHYILEWEIATLCDTARDEVNIAFGYVPFLECGDTLVDTRDGQKYATVQIGEQCWMAENLNVGERIDGSEEMADNGSIEKYCYDNSEANCDVYGGLYQWDEMMQYTTTEVVQGICPEGWHLPTDAEWCILEQEVDPTITCSSTGWRGADGGGKLKETGTTHWTSPNTGATNSSGFMALPGGFRNPNGFFYDQGTYGGWWTSSQESSSNAWRRNLYYSGGQVFRDQDNLNCGFSIRCIRGDSNSTNQPPDSPSSPQPENGTTIISNDTLLSWSCSDPENDPLTYDVYFGAEPTPTQVATEIADTFYTPGTLDFATTYYWKIVAHDDHGNSTEGEVWSFTTTQDSLYVPTEGLVGWWPFLGNANDESGNENHGLLNGVDACQSKIGEPDGAYSFNGESSYIRFSQPFLGGSQTNSFSIFARIKPTQAGNIWGKGYFWGEVNLRINPNDNTIAIVWANSNNGNTYSVVETSNAIEFNEWVDVVFTFDNSNKVFYLNGNQVPVSYYWVAQGGGVISTTQVNSLVNFAQDANSNNIGYEIVSGVITNYFKGIVDDFGIWNRSLNQEEITSIYNSAMTGLPILSNPVPETGATNIPINPTLYWSCTDPENNALTYDVYFGTEATPSQVATGIANTFYTPGTLEYATTYYWKIVAHDDNGNSTEGEVWSFTTLQETNNYSLEFDGVNDFVDFGIIEGFDQNKSLSMETYFLYNGPNGVTDHQYIFQFAQNGPGNGGIVVKNDNTLEFWVLIGGNVGYGVSYTIISGNWYDICGTYNNTTGKMRLYVNGVKVDSTLAPTSGYYSVNNTPSRLGNYHFNSHYFNGNISYAHISNSVLHDEDYEPFQSNTLTDDSFGLWLINEGIGSTIQDLSPFSNNGTINGANWSDDVPNLSPSPWVCGDLLIDEGDGQEYSTVQIGEQCWMAENLNVGERIDGAVGMTNNGVIEKYCYDDLEDNCDVYGGLYQWNEMMQYTTNESVQGICPEGWHLPADAELCSLTSFLDASVNCLYGWSGTDVGGKLKETGFAHWATPNEGADNSSGFTALPGGAKWDPDNSFAYVGLYGYWWSSTQDGPYAWRWCVTYDVSNIQKFNSYKAFGHSARCMKN